LEFSHDCAEIFGELKIKTYDITLPEKKWGYSYGAALHQLCMYQKAYD